MSEYIEAAKRMNGIENGTGKERLKVLDAFRGIAALMVVLFHFAMGREQIKYGFNLGATGVDLFFIISGFVIILTLEKCRSWKDFLAGRFSRLYPAYLVCVVFTAVLIYFKTSPDNVSVNFFSEQFLYNLTMIQYYFHIPDMEGPYWSLIIELVFYAFMFLIFVTGLLKHIEIIGLVFLAFIALICFNFETLCTMPVFDKTIWVFPLIKFFPLFFAGIMMYKMKFEKLTARRLLIVLLCFFTHLFIFYKFYGGETGFLKGYEYIIMLSVFFVVFFVFVLNKLNFLVNAFTLKLGEVSYSLYLVHLYLGTRILMPFFDDKMKFGFFPALLLSVLIVFLLALLITRFLEKPISSFIKKAYAKSSANRV